MSADTTASTTGGAAAPETTDRGWLASLAIYATPIMASMVVLGFASGLPLYMVFQKLSYWLRDVGIERSTIGFFYWVTFAYSFKFLWAPVVDRLRIPGLTAAVGHRRSWMIVAIAGTVAGLVIISGANPAAGLLPVLAGAAVLAYAGATLDISIDAWRIESASTDTQANMAAAYSLGYRFAYMFSGVGLAISEWSNWNVSFLVMAGAMGLCGVLVLVMREPPRAERIDAFAHAPIPERIARSLIDPFKQVLERLGRWIVPVFLLVAIYRLSDFTMGVMASPLYADLEFDRAVVGGIQSGPGVIATMGGLFVGGFVAYRFGLLPAMVIGAVITFLTNGAYAWLAATAAPDDTWRLAIAIVGDNIAGGFVTTVFIAYLSSLTDPVNAATQYALFSSAYSFFAKLASGFSGVLADAVGWVSFFLITASIAIPAALLVIFLMVRAPDIVRGVRPREATPGPARRA